MKTLSVHKCFRSDLACNIALEATRTVALEENGRKEIDIKRYAKVEKVTIKISFVNHNYLTIDKLLI